MSEDVNAGRSSGGLASWLARVSRSRSLWVYHLNTGSCNACDTELLATLGSRYDVENLGISLVATPKQADVVVVTGSVTRHSKEAFLNTIGMVSEPKAIIALGTCAISGEPFIGSPTVVGPPDKFVPVDLRIVGCPVEPAAIIAAILKAGELLKGR